MRPQPLCGFFLLPGSRQPLVFFGLHPSFSIVFKLILGPFTQDKINCEHPVWMVQNLRSRLIQTHGQLKARLILAGEFWAGLILAGLTLDVNVFVKMCSNVVSGLLMFSCWSRERLLRMLCFWLSSRPSRPRDARCSGGKWPAARESRKFPLNSTSFTAGTSLQTTRMIANELFNEVSAQVSQQPNTTLEWNINLKRKWQCKIWLFSWPKPVSREPLLKITRGTKKTTSLLDRYGRELSCEPIQEVRVLCKRYSNKWFLSRLDVSRGLFSLVQSPLALF